MRESQGVSDEHLHFLIMYYVASVFRVGHLCYCIAVMDIIIALFASIRHRVLLRKKHVRTDARHAESWRNV